ncbi:uncharacterized protein LOC108850872 [Raphanus sativus]|uniref:Uncharacterized protein LOC108850872 n=1 Tax=Raphanus sativus TaxID=3726 RepID=A0A6J0N5C0_RAPSA|nr:uncharacterized protein LOC108850872 [Raphanus sativus]
MEIEETNIIEVETKVMNLELDMESKNILSIRVRNLIKDFTEDESGTVTHIRERYIPLETHGITPSHICDLLRGQQVNESQHIGEKLANEINRSLTNDKTLREPVFVSVYVELVKERRLLVLQRLVEEHRVDFKGDKETQCSICIEDLSEKSQQSIIEIPNCLHMFHQNCLSEWLRRKNSCPLCRRSVRPRNWIKKQKLENFTASGVRIRFIDTHPYTN